MEAGGGLVFVHRLSQGVAARDEDRMSMQGTEISKGTIKMSGFQYESSLTFYE